MLAMFERKLMVIVPSFETMLTHANVNLRFAGCCSDSGFVNDIVDKAFCTGERSKQLHDPHLEPTNLCNWGKEAWEKKFWASMGFETVTSVNTGAMLYQLSYEATHWSFLWVLSFP